MYYTFPTIDTLAGDDVEQKLREVGFGYRAKYISQTAKYISKEHSPSFLHQLREVSYEEAKKELMKMNGVGAKVGN